MLQDNVNTPCRYLAAPVLRNLQYVWYTIEPRYSHAYICPLPLYLVRCPVLFVGHQNKDLHCVAISTMLEGGSEPFPVLQVDSRLIRVNEKDAVLERVAKITEVSTRRRGTWWLWLLLLFSGFPRGE